MLLALSVKDFVIVDELQLDFSTGFTVLTGETGAGKSIVLDALGLALGNRSDGAQIVREGRDRAEICASFSYHQQPEIAQWLADNELASEEQELLLRRIVDKNGRSKSLINGQQVTLAQLRELGDSLVDIHGQHAHQSLTRAETQRQLLDAFAQATGLVLQVGQAWQAWQSATQALSAARHNAQAHEIERERLDWQIGEVAALAPVPDEWDSLSQAHDRLAHAAELIQSAQAAVDTLSEQDGSCLSLISSVRSRLGKLAHLDPRLAEVQALLDSVDVELHEAVHSLHDVLSHIDDDPQQLQALESRLQAIMSLARKYRCQPAELGARLAEWQRQLNALAAAADLDSLMEAEQSARAQYQTLTEQLTQARQQAARQLGQKITAEMHSLAMAGAQFDIVLLPLATPAAYGLEDIEYRVATHAGSRLQALSKIASGGELSRISLALQVAISEVAHVPTLIFDEVDVGIGGRVAEVIGKKLRALGARYQVLCVTHLPQVASCGAQHWQVMKQLKNGQTLSQIRVLTPEQRVEEIARMLGGAAMTDTTRQHAAEMLALNADGQAVTTRRGKVKPG